jgi:predicted transcriptional regulator
MSQQQIIKALSNSKSPLSCREIAKITKERFEKISKCLKKLCEYGEVEFLELDRRLASKFYNKNIRRKLRFYYI